MSTIGLNSIYSVNLVIEVVTCQRLHRPGTPTALFGTVMRNLVLKRAERQTHGSVLILP